MVQLGLLLLGSDFIRRRWLILAIGGIAWAVLGVAMGVNALFGLPGIIALGCAVFALFLARSRSET